MKDKIFISFSGGRTSAFMAQYIINSDKYKDYEKLVIFANTGKEKEETLKFVNDCDKNFNLNVLWIEAIINQTKRKGVKYKIVDFETANRDGHPFEDVIKKFGLPSKLYRHCTRDLKEVPLHKAAKDILGKDYYTAIGIRADESHRINWGKAKKLKRLYPLAVDFRVNEKYIRDYWAAQIFDLELKDFEGNCDFCFLKSIRKKLTIAKQDANVANWWNHMESLYSDDNQTMFDYYRNYTVQDLIEESKTPFKAAIDKKELRDKQPEIFDEEMDGEFNCYCAEV